MFLLFLSIFLEISNFPSKSEYCTRQPCKFPFQYKAILYDDCIDIDAPFVWCSPNEFFDEDVMKAAILCFNCTEGCRDEFKCGCPFVEVNESVEENKARKVRVLGQPIPSDWICDGTPDCEDQSDEVSCFCGPGQYQCGCDSLTNRCYGGAGCFQLDQICDGRQHCVSGTDEQFCSQQIVPCPCDRGKAKCESIPVVNLPLILHCDGKIDCIYGNEELNCPCEHGNIQCSITANVLNANCINSTFFCDGKNDCGDWEDEIGCNCADDQFTCNCYLAFNKNCSGLFGCVSASKKCDRKEHCDDGSDEWNCICGENSYWCDCSTNDDTCIGPPCVASVDECNGVNDCLDFSDESHCNCTALNQFACGCDWSDESCKNGSRCVPHDSVCDGINQCGDWSDELECECNPEQFKCICSFTKSCKNQPNCIPNLAVCDGHNDCEDWSDEMECNCTNEKFICKGWRNSKGTRKSCIMKELTCNGKNECGDWSDEFGCICNSDQFQCPCGLQESCREGPSCVSIAATCNGLNDCGDWSDEFTCNCSSKELRCGCIAPSNQICPKFDRCIHIRFITNGVDDCSDKSDEPCITVVKTCLNLPTKVSQCNVDDDAKTLVILNRLATGKNTTCTVVERSVNGNITVCFSSSSSDPECNTPFQCESGEFIPLKLFCDGRKDCCDGSDELEAKSPGFKCTARFSNKMCLLPQVNLYDDVAQCNDNSDLCFGQTAVDKCFHCYDNLLLIGRQVCDGIVDCFDLSDECFCEDQTICNGVFRNFTADCPENHVRCHNDSRCVGVSQVICNGRAECHGDVDERYCQLPDDVGEDDDDDVITCTTKYGKKTAALCDERPECNDMRDECDDCEKTPLFCLDPCRLYFKMGDRYCDGVPDEAWRYINSTECPFRFDERNCPKRFMCDTESSVDVNHVCNGKIDCRFGTDELESVCRHRFYCISGLPLSIEAKLVSNGVYDCNDGSDEAGDFASIYEMVSLPMLRVFLWVMAFLACFGNLFVIIRTIVRIKTGDRISSFTLYNQILILNLAISDFLMGIYLATIAIKSAQFSGNYWVHDKEWRFSKTCSFLGCLVVISSETSVLFMAAITSLRLSMILNPFTGVKHIRVKVCLIIVGIWTFAITLAVVPLLRFTHNYFTSSLWFPNLFTRADIVSKYEAVALAQRINRWKYDDNHTVETWNDAVNYLKHLRLDIKAYVGYYSENSVCLPRFFNSKQDNSWHFSTVLLTINLTLFLYIAVAYIQIYRHGKSRVKSTNTTRNDSLNKRITRLIFTNFCCWVPLCILSYIHLANIPISPVVYSVSAILLMPINSVLNPFLYSATIEMCFLCAFAKCKSLPAILRKPS